MYTMSCRRSKTRRTWRWPCEACRRRCLAVQDEVFHALILQVHERFSELVHGGLAKRLTLMYPTLSSTMWAASML